MKDVTSQENLLENFELMIQKATRLFIELTSHAKKEAKHIIVSLLQKIESIIDEDNRKLNMTVNSDVYDEALTLCQSNVDRSYPKVDLALLNSHESQAPSSFCVPEPSQPTNKLQKNANELRTSSKTYQITSKRLENKLYAISNNERTTNNSNADISLLHNQNSIAENEVKQDSDVLNHAKQTDNEAPDACAFLGTEQNKLPSHDNGPFVLTKCEKGVDYSNILFKNYEYPVNCPDCKLSLNFEELFVKHMKDVHKTSFITCQSCTGNFLPQHFSNHACNSESNKSAQKNSNPVKCKSCEKSFNDRRELVRHVKSEHRQARNTCLDCKSCGMKFTMYSMLLNHRKYHHGKNINCDKCNLVFSTRDEYVRHCKIHEQTAQIPKKDKPKKKKVRQPTPSKCELHKCSNCELKFGNKKVLRKHLYHVHSITIPEKRNHKCDICDKGFSRPSHLEMHKQTHTGVKLHECKECNKKFSLMKALKLHACPKNPKNKDVETSQRKFLCDLCGNSFCSKGSLERHFFNIHKDEKPYKCPDCDFRCKLRQNLNRHINIHHCRNISDKKFKCKECHKCFRTKNNMKDHMLYLHSNRREFSCPECDKSFKKNGELQRHIKIHKKRKKENYTCSCNKTFNRKFSFKRHIAKVHKHDLKSSSIPSMVVCALNSSATLDNPNQENLPLASITNTLQSTSNQIQGFVNSSIAGQEIPIQLNSIQKTELSKDKIPKVFEQKFTEISESVSSALTDLTPVQNPHSSFSLLSSLQSFDKSDQLLPSMCFDRQPEAFIPETNSCNIQNDYYLPNTYSQPGEISIADCMTLDLQTSNEPSNFDQNQVNYQGTCAQDDGNYNAMMNQDCRMNSSFLDHYLTSFNMNNQDSYMPNSYENVPATQPGYDISDLSSIPLATNPNEYCLNDGMPNLAQNMQANNFMTPYSNDSICDLQTSQFMSCNQSIVPPQTDPENDFQQCYNDIPCLLGPNTAQLIPTNQSDFENMNCHPDYLNPHLYSGNNQLK